MERDSIKYTMGGTYQKPLLGKLGALFVRQPAMRAAPVVDMWPVKLTDVSVWQGKIDFTRMRVKAQAVYIRAGYGNDGYDPNAEANTNGAFEAAMPWGLYWFVKAGKDFKKHVNSFYSIWQDYGGQLPPVWDCEYTDYLTNVRNNTTNWLTKLVNQWEDLSGVAPMIYTRASWWDAYTYRTDWPKYLMLWAAHYNPNISEPNIPADWGKVANPRSWSFWQWSADGNGQGAAYGVESKSIDLNRWNGTIDQFNKQFKVSIKPLDGSVTPPVDPPVEPPVAPPGDLFNPLYRVKVTAAALNVRGGPDAGTTDLGELTKDSVVPIISEVGDWLEIGGYIHKNYTQKVG